MSWMKIPLPKKKGKKNDDATTVQWNKITTKCGDIEWKHWQGKWRILHIDKQTSEWTNCFIERLTKFINFPSLPSPVHASKIYSVMQKSSSFFHVLISWILSCHHTPFLLKVHRKVSLDKTNYNLRVPPKFFRKKIDRANLLDRSCFCKSLYVAYTHFQTLLFHYICTYSIHWTFVTNTSERNNVYVHIETHSSSKTQAVEALRTPFQMGFKWMCKWMYNTSNPASERQRFETMMLKKLNLNLTEVYIAPLNEQVQQTIVNENRQLNM